MELIKEEKILLKPKDILPSSPLVEVISVINPAAIRLPNGNILLYVRVIEKLIKDSDDKYYYSPRMTGKEKFNLILDRFDKDSVETKNLLDFVFKDGTKRLTFISHLRRIILDSFGFKIKSIEQKPGFFGLSWDGELGVEDPRITKIKKLYVMTYVSLSRNTNVSTSIAISNDCKKWYRRGIIFEEQNKDVVIFPEFINKEYVALNRPEGSFAFTHPHIWISYSRNLEQWGKPKPLILSEKKGWDSSKVGAGPPPIKTKKGWLLFYHGVTEKTQRANMTARLINKLLGKETKTFSYNIGVALLDLNNPEKILAKTKSPLILPNKKYEKGTLEKKDVVFTTGIVVDKNNKNLLLYSGGGDIVTTIKKVSFDDVFEKMEKITKPLSFTAD